MGQFKAFKNATIALEVHCICSIASSPPPAIMVLPWPEIYVI